MGLIAIPGIIASAEHLLTWTTAPAPGFGATVIRTIRHDGTYWVATAQAGKIRWVVDPLDVWAPAAAPGFGGAADLIGCDYAVDEGQWVAVDLIGNTARNTADPTGTWDVTPCFIGGNLSVVKRGLGDWVIGNYGSDFSVAVNAAGPWVNNLNQFGGKQILGLGCGATYWAACGQDTQFRTAVDPNGAWTLRATPFVGGDDIYGIHYSADQNMWVMTGSAGKIAYTTDPTGLTDPWTLNTDHPFGGAEIVWDVSYGGGRWVAVTLSGLIATAGDPARRWTLNDNGFGGTAIRSVCWGSDGNWVAVGDGGKMEVGR